MIDAVPGLTVVDLVADHETDDVARQHLKELALVHLDNFPGHEHVIGEVAEAMREWPDPEVIVHPWLLVVNGQPAGEYIFHTNLRRRMILVHFVAMSHEVHASLPHDWRHQVTEAMIETAIADARQRGTSLIGLMGEIPPSHLRLWEAFGYRGVNADYREPHHGRHWPEYGDLEFFDMLACVGRIDAGTEVPFRDVATAGLQAFLIDHYRLPPDYPTVVLALEQAAAND